MILEKLLHTAKAHTTHGREGGAFHSDDGRLDVKLSPLGGPGAGISPEQLVAAGGSACFLAAIKLVAGKENVTLPRDVAIGAQGDLGKMHGDCRLAPRLNVSL